MKKARYILSAAVLAAVMSAAPLTVAAEGRDITVSTEIAPAYIVTIPTNTRVYFNVVDSDFGKVELTQAQLEPQKCVKVSLLTDNLLENKEDAGKVLPFTIYEGTAAGTSGQVFSFATFTTVGENSDLTIHIEQDDWNKAYAGEYEDTVTFQIEYTNQ